MSERSELWDPTRKRPILGKLDRVCFALICISLAITFRSAKADDLAPAAAPPRQATDSPLSSDVSKARSLFERGKSLLGEDRLAEACAAFAESESLDPAGGTLLNLAECRGRSGAYASATEALEAALALANSAGRDDAKQFIHGKLQEIAAKVAHLRVELPRTSPRDLVVRIDERIVELKDSAVEVAVDPGVHDISLEAASRLPFKTTVWVRGEGAFVSIVLPELSPLPSPLVRKSNTSTPPQNGSQAANVAGWALTAAGSTVIVIGGILGGLALSRAHDARVMCPQIDCSVVDGVLASRESASFGDGSTAAFVAGGSLAVAGVTMIILTQPSLHPTRSVGLATKVAW